MDDQATNPLAELLGQILKGPILGVRMGLSATPAGQEDAGLPQFEEKVWPLDADSDEIPVLPAEVVSGVAGGSLFLDALPVMRASRRWTAGEGLRGSAAFLWQTLSSLPAGTDVAVLVPMATLTGPHYSVLRKLLEEQHTIRWLVYLSNQYRIISNIDTGFLLPIFVVTVGRTEEGPRLIRLLDLRQCPPEEWPREVEHAKNRSGGETNCSIVLRNRILGEEPWTYKRFTKAFQESREDAAQLGQLRPLGELVEDMSTGIEIRLAKDKGVQSRGDEDSLPKSTIGLFGGRELRPDGTLDEVHHWIPAASVTEEPRVQRGDVLIRAITDPGPSGPRILAATAPDGTNAVFSQRIVRLRWKASVPVHVRELLVAWLKSWRASESLLAAGASMHVSIPLLYNLEVPYPSERVIEALGELTEYESWYRDRAEHVRNARQAIFEAERYVDAVRLLLESHRAEHERVTAAESSQRFDYRVRNSYPHPIALRREQILRMDDGKDRIEAIIECAEHLLHYLAVLAILQLASLDQTKPLPQALVDKHSLHFDWGTSSNILDQAVSATTKHKDPLALPFPQLEQLEKSRPQAALFHKAEARLREWRNAHSHLRRQPPSEMVETSRDFAQALDDILAAVAFLTDLPLVRVCDYVLDELDESRKAVFEYIRGASPVFEVSEQTVDTELPRGRLGVLPRDGAFISLAPWLVWQTCEVCQRPEVFIFNRLAPKRVAFVAMESGHALESETIAGRFHKLVAASKSE